MFRKIEPGARQAAWEADGLDWLTVPGGARVVQVLERADDHLGLEALASSSPTSRAAEDFGRLLAVTHQAGAEAFGVGPEGWTGDGYQGPVDDLLPLPLRPVDTWGEMYAQLRVRPMARWAAKRHEFSSDEVAVFDHLADRLAAGDLAPEEPPARIHGDMWSGNVMWTPDGCVLIDPMAHAGHREQDLATLGLFGCPHLDRIVAAYDEVAPLADGWRDRIGLMQLHMVLLHVVLFGGGYASQALAIARRYL